MAQRDLKVTLIGEDKTSGAFSSAGSGVAGLVTKVGLLGGAVGLATFAKTAVTAGADFQATMTQMSAIAGVPKQDLKELSDLALKMGADTKFSAQQAADAMLELSKGGLTAAQIKAGVLKETLTLAAAGGIELAQAGTVMSNALNTFNLTAEQSGQVAAALAGGANASTASVESLGMALSQVGPGAKNAGLSIQETVAALAAFDNAGIKGTDAGTSLKTFLTRLVPTTKAATNAFVDLGLAQFSSQKAAAFLRQNGIEPLGTSQDVLEGQLRKLSASLAVVPEGSTAARVAFDKLMTSSTVLQNNFLDGQGNFKDLTSIAGSLGTALNGLNDEQRTQALTTLFGSDATRAATVLANEGAVGIAKMIKATSDQAAAQKVATATTSGAAGALEQMRGSFDTLATVIGLKMLPAVTAAALGATVFLNALTDGLPAVGAIASAIGGTLGPVLQAMIASLGFVVDKLGGLGNAATILLAVMSPVLVVLAAQFAAMGVAAVVSGALTVASFVRTAAAAVASGAAMYVNSVRVIAGFVAMGASAAASAVVSIAGWVATAAAAVASVATQVAAWALLGAQSLLAAAKVAAAWLIAMGPIGLVVAAVIALAAVVISNWDTIRSTITNAATSVLEFLKANWPIILSVITGPIGAIVIAIARHWDQIKAVFITGSSAAVGIMQSLPGKLLGALGNLGGLLVDAGGDLLRGLANGITGAIGGVIDAAKQAAKAAVDAVKGALGINSPSKVFAALGANVGQGMALGIDGQRRSVGTSAQDLLDMASLSLPGGTGRMNARLASTAATAPAGGTAGTADRTDELIALLVEQNTLLRAMPREMQTMDRQGVKRG